MNNLLVKKSFTIFEGLFGEWGGIEITYYALCLMVGILLGAAIAVVLFKRRGIKTDLILDVLIAVIPCSIICARIWYVVFDWDEFVVDGKPDFLRMINIRTGGISILGAIAGGALGLFIVARIHRMPFLKFADIGGVVLPIGQAVGRFGNFFNQEVYGFATDITWFPYSVYIEADGQYHLALFFHEAVLNLIVFGLLFTFLFFYKGKRNGYALGAYLFFYGLIRASMEPLRDGQFNMGKVILGLPGMTWISILMMLLGLGIVIFLLVKDIQEKNYWWKGFFKKQAVLETSTEDNQVSNQTELTEDNQVLSQTELTEDNQEQQEQNETNDN